MKSTVFTMNQDVKSGNVLLTKDGRAKLGKIWYRLPFFLFSLLVRSLIGDFGISAQLTDTIMKRRTVIGSPYWMAPGTSQTEFCNDLIRQC